MQIRLNRPAIEIHRQAARIYLVSGILVILLTLGAGLVPAERGNHLLELSIGGVFVVVFALLIHRGWWPLSGLLVLSNGWRAGLYFLQGLGWHYEVITRQWIPVESRPVAFFSAALLVVVVLALGRSAWVGWRHWRSPGTA